MRMAGRWYFGVAAIALAAVASAPSSRLSAQQNSAASVSVGGNDLGGVVAGPNGPEAGVWVIAETTDLPTKYVKIVVTDDSGRGCAATAWSIRKSRRPRPERFST